ncbi:serine/threonine protein kinase [Herbiconiux sp. CPCC 205716]|uniref:non-specific serine/threonine protein kinase n=1 Tax=Herbiconiux gentiana TaxID=2970912 RepID=A0ABT2GIG2_9MICO|nr:serine/threonine-protein kinase [Herbiconiux gentiana]MCS5716002.1 serine/threonine protein kinase [Herbiconiux gentiana]
MSARRPPSAPPEIPGFSFVELLGSGGFADVFLYEQRMPRRRVAIKVLLAEALTEGARESFDAEANLMAQLSTHPSIVTIYQADIAGDGRPYLAMEYCPKPNLGARYRREKISVAEALRIGVQVAGAVETSHRAGILHRDIKPANILVTEYNRPALTDFGISVALVGGVGSGSSGANGSGGGAEQESVGMSIPWSPPEVFGAVAQSGAAADIYALGATVYTILAGRSPFEVPGGANTGLDLIARIQSAPLAPTGRMDVPASLEQVLATAMAKRPDERYTSALEFARALQKIQLELAMSVTPADVLDDTLPSDDFEEEDDGNTRIRGIVTIDPTAPAPPRGRRTPPPVAPAPAPRPPVSAPSPSASGHFPPQNPVFSAESDHSPRGGGRVRAGGAEDVLEETVQRAGSGAVDAGPAPAATGARRSRVPWIVASAALVLLVGVGALVFALNGGAGSPAEQNAEATDEPVDTVQIDNAAVQAPTDIVATPGPDGVVFTWTNPDPQDGDTYRWAPATPGAEQQARSIDKPTVTVVPEGGQPVCIDVSVVRSDGRGSDAATGCST